MNRMRFDLDGSLPDAGDGEEMERVDRCSLARIENFDGDNPSSLRRVQNESVDFNGFFDFYIWFALLLLKTGINPILCLLRLLSLVDWSRVFFSQKGECFILRHEQRCVIASSLKALSKARGWSLAHGKTHVALPLQTTRQRGLVTGPRDS